jgi:hypothetical protein
MFAQARMLECDRQLPEELPTDAPLRDLGCPEPTTSEQFFKEIDMSGPIRKHELAALENLSRGQGENEIDEETLQRLKSLGLIEAIRQGWRLTQSGKMDLQRRKSVGSLKR